MTVTIASWGPGGRPIGTKKHRLYTRYILPSFGGYIIPSPPITRTVHWFFSSFDPCHCHSPSTWVNFRRQRLMRPRKRTATRNRPRPMCFGEWSRWPSYNGNVSSGWWIKSLIWENRKKSTKIHLSKAGHGKGVSKWKTAPYVVQYGFTLQPCSRLKEDARSQ